MMKIPDPGRGLARCLGLAAAAMLVLSTAASQRAEALSLINPGAVPTAKYAAEGLTTEVRGGHGGGGHGGGGGFHGGGAAFHGGGGFRGGGAAMAAASEAAVPCSMAGGFAPGTFSAEAAFATAGLRSGTTAFTGTSMGPIMMITRTIITRTAAAGSSGPIMVRAASVTTATGTAVGIIGATGERHRDG